VVLLFVEAVIVAESWRGLTGFAHLIGITGPAAWGVPVTLDGVSLVAALVALRAEFAGEASGVYRATLFAFTVRRPDERAASAADEADDDSWPLRGHRPGARHAKRHGHDDRRR
jgi:hypothetical protein